MKRWLLILFIAFIAAPAVYLWFRNSAPPSMPFAKAARETVVSQLSTNGKVEPYEWVEVRSDRAALIDGVHVHAGQVVAAGAALVTLRAAEMQSEMAAAQSRLAQANSEIEALDKGGKAAELAELDGAIANLRVEKEPAAREIATLERLVQNKAATAAELTAARDKLSRVETEIASLEKRRGSLVVPGDRAAATARRRDAEAAVALAQRKISTSVLRAPRAGAVYRLEARPGMFLAAGDLVAEVGVLDRLRVKVFIDEPDLGRIRKDLPVALTWDALPGKVWNAAIERVPTQVKPLGARQVGEVWTVAQNPDRDLPPGANVNAVIRTEVVEKALTIPKEALRRLDGSPGAYVLEGDHIVWRRLSTGVASVGKVEVRQGLKDGDAVALPTDQPLRSGAKVTARFSQ